MYIADAEEARALSLLLRRKLRGLTGVDVWIAPPTPFIAEIANLLESSPIKVGTQKVTYHADPKHTGSISATMMKGVGASFVIIGHSEYRSAAGTNDKVRAQLERTLDSGLVPVLCIGEESRSPEADYFSFVEGQLNAALRNVPKNLLKKLIVAYEPVWAIGKDASQAMKPADLREMGIFIRKILAELVGRESALKVPVLYGGSVEAENASTLIQEGGVNGFLVGRASARADSFLAIIEAVRQGSR
ncbi:MAG: triosephosphate isomerase (TIM) [Parcubacteria group bacterium Gr01-1014_56]|nr:MAG: triosephosphate isomerase (TIM) [Parcubacteria group bacterium Gr01-1014_56]